MIAKAVKDIGPEVVRSSQRQMLELSTNKIECGVNMCEFALRSELRAWN